MINPKLPSPCLQSPSLPLRWLAIVSYRQRLFSLDCIFGIDPALVCFPVLLSFDINPFPYKYLNLYQLRWPFPSMQLSNIHLHCAWDIFQVFFPQSILTHSSTHCIFLPSKLLGIYKYNLTTRTPCIYIIANYCILPLF